MLNVNSSLILKFQKSKKDKTIKLVVESKVALLQIQAIGRNLNTPHRYLLVLFQYSGG